MLRPQIDKELVKVIVAKLRDATASAVRAQVEDALEKHHFKWRSVIPHTEVPRYFDHRVSEARIREYIRGKDLPQGTDLPLPAVKKGNMYFVEIDKLLRWQAGKCAAEDLSAWQRERLDE